MICASHIDVHVNLHPLPYVWAMLSQDAIVCPASLGTRGESRMLPVCHRVSHNISHIIMSISHACISAVAELHAQRSHSQATLRPRRTRRSGEVTSESGVGPSGEAPKASSFSLCQGCDCKIQKP